MEQSEFIKILEEKAIKYEIKVGTIFNLWYNISPYDIISILGNNLGYVDLRLLKSLPENVQFNNGGYVNLDLLKYLPKSTKFNNGGNVYLDSLISQPKVTQFNNGGYVYLKSIVFKLKKSYIKSYIKRHNIKVKDGKVILYKRVSKDFLTQEDKEWQTRWEIGSTLTCSDWDPEKEECGVGKFHACAKPFWCDWFRYERDDKYIAIEVKVEDLYEWTENPIYPQKISFREGKVLYECDRYGTKI